MKPVELLQPSQSLFDLVEMALPFLMTSLEGPKLLRRVEQSLLPGGGSNDVQPAQMATRMASDDDDRLARRLEPAEARRLALRRLIQALFANLVEERVRLGPQFLELLHDFVRKPEAPPTG